MTPLTIAFVTTALFGGIVVLAGLSVIVRRETQRSLAFDRRLGVPRRLALAAGLGPSDSARRSGSSEGLGEFSRVLVRAGSLLAPVGAAEREKLGQMLRAAGFGQRDALSVFLTIKFVVALAAGAGTGFLAVGTAFGQAYGFLAVVVAFAGFVLGGIIPEYALRASRAKRAQRMGAALPDALDLMVMGLGSGLTFERTLATVAEELQPIEPHLAAEFLLMEAELRVGVDRRTVLDAFQRRTAVEGLRDLAMTLIQSERFGTPLTQSVRNIAANERAQRALRVETSTQRLPVLMTLPMLLFVVPGIMCLVAGPSFLAAIDALGSLGGQ